MNRSSIYILIAIMIVIPLSISGYTFWKTGAFDLVNQVLGPSFWIGVVVFIAFTISILFFGMRLGRKIIKPKTIANGLPASATVIRSYQGNLKVTFGGVQENFKMIIEVNVRNNNGETWQAKMEEMIPIQQIGIFQPGVCFNVLYDPKDRSEVVFDQSEKK